MSVTQKLAKRLGVFAVAGALIATAAAPANGAFRDKDCSDFKTQRKAQKFFKKNGGPRNDPHGLDADNDGIACEDLR